MADPLKYLIFLSAEGETAEIPVPGNGVPDDALLAALLHTDVTERLRLPVKPAEFPGDAALCYFIDARGGERGLPVNFAGTCFYHTGCPIFGDLLLARCSIEHPEGAIEAFSGAESRILRTWLRENFGSVIK